jgi:hypothetical protein
MAVIGPGCVLPPWRPFTTSLTVPYQTTGTFARSREAVRGGPRRPVDSPARFERRPPVAGRRQGLLRGWLRGRARRGAAEVPDTFGKSPGLALGSLPWPA